MKPFKLISLRKRERKKIIVLETDYLLARKDLYRTSGRGVPFFDGSGTKKKRIELRSICRKTG